MSRFSKLLAALAVVLGAGPAHAQATAPDTENPTTIALMGTIPIYWGEASDMEDLLSGDAQPHWARGEIERYAEPVPLDYLSPQSLAPYHYLLMAQPRGLSPEENVALDDWVRAGGRLLLFADPLMTGASLFHIGDRRRPQDVALLSPILARWGLELVFDPAQEEGPKLADHFGDPLPVNMRGEWHYLEAGEQPCAIPGDGLLAHCRIGQGQALLVADAAMLDIVGPYPHARTAFGWLLEHGLGMTRENLPATSESLRENAGNEGISGETALVQKDD